MGLGSRFVNACQCLQKLGPSPPLEMTSAPTLLERLQAWRVWRARTLRIGPASLLQSALLSDVASTQPLTFLDLQRVMETHVVPSARIQELSHEVSCAAAPSTGHLPCFPVQDRCSQSCL